jgi:hypothetical protein
MVAGIMVAIAACSTSAGGPPTVAAARLAIEMGLPKSWSIARAEDGQVPWGHYWGDWSANYSGPKGTLLVLVGPRPSHLCWQSASGQWHRDAIGREAIAMWLMPSAYSQGFWSWVNPHAPPKAPLMFSGASLKVYAQPSAHTIDADETAIKAILAKATATGCADESQSVSWSSWRSDMARALE